MGNTTLPIGTDISKYQTSRDGKIKPVMELLNSQTDFIAMRSGISYAYVDPMFAWYWQRAFRPRIAYHVIYPGEDAQKQVNHFLNIVKPTANDRLALDMELDHGVGKARITDMMLDCAERLKSSTGRYPIIYSRASWVNEFLEMVSHWADDFDWWLANYLKRLPAPQFTPEKAPPPTLPNGVKRWLIHQTAERGDGSKFGVVSHYIDIDRWNTANVSIDDYFGLGTSHEIYLPIISTPEPDPDYPEGLLKVQVWGQHDERWANDRMGSSYFTLAQKGCLVDVVAVYLRFLGIDTDPKRYNQLLSERNGYQYTVEGNIIYPSMYWKMPGKLFPGKIAEDLTDYVWFTGGAGWQTRARKILASGRPFLAQVSMPGGLQHWVLVVGELNGEFWCVDPEHGDCKPLSLRYQNKVYRISAYKRI